MKLKTIVLSLAVVTMFFASCEDTKKKEAEAQAQAEQMRMERERDSLMQVEADNQAKMADMEANSIAAKAMGNENLSTLVSALQAADMAQTMKAEGEYTVFAPSNEAFSKVPKATMDNLMKPENKEQLQKLLQYHVLQGKMNSADVVAKIKAANNKLDVTTLNGEVLTLSEKDGKVMVKDAKGNTATVSTADVDASNGVVHVVDKVLMPKM
ncbi:fasciclin domain-containing protein [Aequorivita sp. SDUM287046]|uniref:Fasciclin domain-containing protein n=1 Tax=Aequorivita aurantiaca TaxID=3053356 RepID=A0ABT8DEH0_9FLAO|nr:fasciclin domain-containing protein [Aequorivita aurantiaca]MDN3723705.1 fasciclin domain-containing protein [Aequorivita aurantiaca]